MRSDCQGSTNDRRRKPTTHKRESEGEFQRQEQPGGKHERVDGTGSNLGVEHPFYSGFARLLVLMRTHEELSLDPQLILEVYASFDEMMTAKDATYLEQEKRECECRSKEAGEPDQPLSRRVTRLNQVLVSKKQYSGKGCDRKNSEKFRAEVVYGVIARAHFAVRGEQDVYPLVSLTIRAGSVVRHGVAVVHRDSSRAASAARLIIPPDAVGCKPIGGKILTGRQWHIHHRLEPSGHAR